MTYYDNDLGIFTDSTYFAISPHLEEIRYSTDFVMVTIKYEPRTPDDQICKLLHKHYRMTKTIPTRFSNSLAWKDLFKKRTYFDFAKGAYAMVLTNRARALRHHNAILIVYNPLPEHLMKLHQILAGSKSVKAYWLSGIEFTFDFIMKRKQYVRKMQKYLRRTTYFQYGRIAFSYGALKRLTDYINTRRSVKQIRTYTHPKDYKEDRKIYHKVLRWELAINRVKAKRIGLISLEDLAKYDLGILDEVRLCRPIPYKFWQSIMSFNTDGYFCDLIGRKFSRWGFMRTLIWARTKIVGCPKNCEEFEFECPKEVTDSDLSGMKKFKAVQQCAYAKPFKNLRRDFTEEIESFKIYRRRMREAFQAWQKQGP